MAFALLNFPSIASFKGNFLGFVALLPSLSVPKNPTIKVKLHSCITGWVPCMINKVFVFLKIVSIFST